MNGRDAFLHLLNLLSACSEHGLLISEAELAQFPCEAANALESQGLIQKSKPATSITCPGCERNCFMPVELGGIGRKPSLPFIMCDKPEAGIGRVEVLPALLRRWLFNMHNLCIFVSAQLDLRQLPVRPSRKANQWNLGLAHGRKKVQMIGIREGASIVISAGNKTMPLGDVIEFIHDAYRLDTKRVMHLVNISTAADPGISPSEKRREERKNETNEKYATFQKDFEKKRRINPNLTLSAFIKHTVQKNRSLNPATLRRRLHQ